MVRLNALGQSSIEVGDVRIGPEQPYLFAIALYLIVERGKKIPRQALVDLIWPRVSSEKHARQRFRQALLRLRECGVPVIGDNGTLLIEKSAAQTDFDGLASPEAIRPGESLEFLPHYAPRISDLFLDWVDTQRSRVHAGVQRVFLLRMQQARSRGDWTEVDAVAVECLRLDPYNEEAVMAHAECAAMRGSKREALIILDSYMEALGSHVGTIGLPAKILRTRIAERLTDQRYAVISEQHFVGREGSMKLLQGLLRDAQQSAGSATLIWGEPGIGKSRLVQEITQVASLEGARVVSTKCHPTDAGRPLSAFADLVPVLKTLPGALGCSAQTLSLLQRLTDRNRSETFPTQEAGDAAFLAATIRRAVFDLVDAVADEGLLIMVIEDVHWLDEPSWAILSAMVEWSTTRTLLILMTSRTAHATESKVADPDRGFHRHHLKPLIDADSRALLDRLAGDDANPLPDTVRAWSVEAAEGNPYYLRELVRHWMETQQSFGVPRSLAELIEARLNRLSSLALRVLQLCAAFGKHSSYERLEKATGYANHVLLDAIEELSSAVMLAADKAGIAVKHDLLAAAALRRLGGPALKLVHRQVARVLEAEIKEKHTAALMWDCAEHWQRAGESARAVMTAKLCAMHLHSVGQTHKAIELYDRVLPICVTPEERLDVLLELAACLKAVGQWLRLEEIVTQAELLIANSMRGAAADDALVLLRIETEWRLRAGWDSSIAQLVTFAHDGSKRPEQRIQAAHLGIILCAEKNRTEEAHSLSRVTEHLAPTANQEALVAHSLMIFHADFGSLDQAVEHGEALLALESSTGDPASMSRARTNVAHCYRRVGRIDDARSLLKANFVFAADHGLAGQSARAAATLAMVGLQAENVEEASYWYALGMEQATALDELPLSETFGYIKARLGLSDGDLNPAYEFLNRLAHQIPAHEMSLRFRQTEAAIRWRIQMSTAAEIDRIHLEEIAEEFEAHCGTGQFDFFAHTLYDVLNFVGESKRAAELLRRYVEHHRRDRGPLSPSLAAALRQLQSSP